MDPPTTRSQTAAHYHAHLLGRTPRYKPRLRPGRELVFGQALRHRTFDRHRGTFVHVLVKSQSPARLRPKARKDQKPWRNATNPLRTLITETVLPLTPETFNHHIEHPLNSHFRLRKLVAFENVVASNHTTHCNRVSPFCLSNIRRLSYLAA